eukprot:TRINITY_DN2758_c0_g1_i4.p1 TRINITY_DN2758_c0_g1~~TRINITY_DN2758_c0_g1_i4.p1  ORF type:complete len:159 (+),score=25.99 TRINITY_DN2758_c0_g1_i4:539-1015(+)
MREYFVENDLIVAEVQKFYDDGVAFLQIRRGHGKLSNGLFLSAPPALIQRVSSHIVRLQCGVTVVLGNNGYIWITEPKDEEETEADVEDDPPQKTINLELREKIGRVRNCIIALKNNFLAIHPESIMEVYRASRKYEVKQLLEALVMEDIVKSLKKKR